MAESASPHHRAFAMNGVTDHPFRHIQKRYGCPDIVVTEFTPVNGICAGADALLKDLLYDETQRPIVAQIYGSAPDEFRTAAIVLCQLGFDGIDINMGCPSKAVASTRGSGAALELRTPELAQQIMHETKRGVADWVNGKTVRDCPAIPGGSPTKSKPCTAGCRKPIDSTACTGQREDEDRVRRRVPQEWIPIPGWTAPPTP